MLYNSKRGRAHRVAVLTLVCAAIALAVPMSASALPGTGVLFGSSVDSLTCQFSADVALTPRSGQFPSWPMFVIDGNYTLSGTGTCVKLDGDSGDASTGVYTVNVSGSGPYRSQLSCGQNLSLGGGLGFLSSDPNFEGPFASTQLRIDIVGAFASVNNVATAGPGAGTILLLSPYNAERTNGFGSGVVVHTETDANNDTCPYVYDMHLDGAVTMAV